MMSDVAERQHRALAFLSAVVLHPEVLAIHFNTVAAFPHIGTKIN